MRSYFSMHNHDKLPIELLRRGIVDMQDLLCAYEDHLMNIRHASDNTVSSYMRDIRQFSEWLAHEGIDSFIEVDERSIRKYLECLQTAGKSEATVSRSLASLKNFYSYLAAIGSISENPVSVDIHVSRGTKHLPQILSGEEVETLLKQPVCDDPKGARDKAMLEVMYATGMRVSELIGLDLSDVMLESGMIRCKGNKAIRIIPLYPEARKALEYYVKEMRNYIVQSPEENALFLNVSGARMSRQGFWKVLKSYQVRAGIDKEITPHTLRHSFAVHLLENGADLASLRALMGHSDISSTQIYSQMINKDVREAYRKAHPKAQE